MPGFWFNPWGTEHAPKKQAYDSPTGVIDIKEMVEFFDSLAGLPWSDRAPNVSSPSFLPPSRIRSLTNAYQPQSVYTRVSAFYARLAADDARFRLGHAPAATPPVFGGASGVFQRGVYRDEERARLDLSSPDVQKFYSYWMGFQCTRGRYAWVEPYYCGCRMQGCPSAKANLRVQKGMRDAFAEVVRVSSFFFFLHFAVAYYINAAVDDDAEGSRSALSGISGEENGWDSVQRGD
jgi:hypothetical protein